MKNLRLFLFIIALSFGVFGGNQQAGAQDYCTPSISHAYEGWDFIYGCYINGNYYYNYSDEGYSDYSGSYYYYCTAGDEVYVEFWNGGQNGMAQIGRLWCDWNQDGDFDEEGETFDVNNTDDWSYWGFYIDVPKTSNAGDIRMRMGLMDTKNGGPCDDYDYGEFEDYTLNVYVPFEILEQPQGSTVCGTNGQAVTSIVATGSKIQYQWQKYSQEYGDWINLEGQNDTKVSLDDSNLDFIADGAYYANSIRCYVTSSDGEMYSKEAWVEYYTNVDMQLYENTTVGYKCEGSTLELTAEIQGSFQGGVVWQKMDQNGQWWDVQTESKATGPYYTSVYTVSDFSRDDAGEYRIVTNNNWVCGGKQLSKSVFVNFSEEFEFHSVSDDVEICAPNTLRLKADAFGTIIGYQWYFNGEPLNGYAATTANYENENTAKENSGTYWCEIRYVTCDGIETMTTEPVNVKINGFYNVTIQPEDKTLCEGENTSLAVGVDGAIFEYQWEKDGKPIPLSENPTADKAFIELNKITYDKSGKYRCRILVESCENGISYDYSDEVTVYVNRPGYMVLPPATVFADLGETVSFSFDAHVASLPPIHSVTIQWYRNGQPLKNSAKYSGTNSGVLSIRKIANDDYSADYSVTITGKCGFVASENFGIQMKPVITITQQPMPVMICEGGSAVFTTEASLNTGSPFFSYKWLLDGVQINEGADFSGTMTNSLTVSNAKSEYTGIIQCVVNLSNLSVTSNGAGLTVNENPEITAKSDNEITVDENAALNLYVTESGTGPVSIQWIKDGADLAGETSGTFSKSAASLSDAGVYQVRLGNVCGEFVFDVTTVTVADGGLISGVEDEFDNGVYSAPNPFDRNATINYWMPEAGNVSVTLASAAGEQVAVLDQGYKPAGNHTCALNAEALKLGSGVYYYTVRSDKATVTRQIVRIK